MEAHPFSLVKEYLTSHREGILELLSDLVQIPSHSSQPDGVNSVGDRVCSELERLNYVTDRSRGGQDEQPKWLETLMLSDYDRDRLGDHRIAQWQGPGHGRVLLLGDLDTAYTSTKSFEFRVEGDKALGPGVADMKGGLAVAVYALKALHANGLNNLAAVECIFSADEQAGSLSSRPLIEESGRNTDWVFCVECARDGGNLIGARAQTGIAKLEVFGREAHAGSAYNLGVSAIDAMARKVVAIHKLSDPARGIYLCVGQIEGGWRRTVIAGHCMVTIDIRTQDQASWNYVEQALKKIANKEEIPGSHSSLLIACHRPAVPWTAKTDKLIEIARKAGIEIGVDFGVIKSPAAGSSAFVGPLGLPCLDGMGPIGGDLMTDHEYVSIQSLIDRAALLACVMYSLGSGAWSGSIENTVR